MQSPALPVVLPLLMAAILGATGSLLPRRLLDLLAILTSARCAESAYSWSGSPPPDLSSTGSATGSPIHMAISPSASVSRSIRSALIGGIVALLVLAATIFSWSYFESIKSLYHSLMLVFLAAMCGLCLTGDLFNLFVWFELMTAVAVGLCGYKSEERRPLLGALNFAISNTVGAFLSLTAVALLYAFTGSLNMSEVGRSLAAHNPGPVFVSVTFLLLIAGFLVKAAAFPFHFWLADAHAVAPTPVCILFSGVMVELGVYAIARLYWVVFAPLLGVECHAVQVILLTMGCGSVGRRRFLLRAAALQTLAGILHHQPRRFDVYCTGTTEIRCHRWIGNLCRRTRSD